MKIYLASTSPRRLSLLKEAGIAVHKMKPDYEEVDKKHLSTRQLVKNHALGKAASMAGLVSKGVLVAADTLVIFRGKRIGKPKDMKGAFRILSLLQGKTHSVLTGVAVLSIKKGAVQSKIYFAEKTEVTLKPLSPEGIKTYFKRINPLDKAGAYAIQSQRQTIVSHIKGSYTNAVGLPMEKLKKVLDMLE